MMKQRLMICVLLVTVSLAVPAMGSTPTPTNKPVSTWLYVGGSGPGNYSTIKAAVAAAFDGDTVFVYDDSSPYREAVVIDHSITLLGENRDTTIINGSNVNVSYFMITADHVTVSGFTFTGAVFSGIHVHSDGNLLTDLKFVHNCEGICMFYNESLHRLQGNRVTASVFLNNCVGIMCSDLNATVIDHNSFQDNQVGVSMMDVFDSNISSNMMLDEAAIADQWGYHNTFARNTIKGAIIGVCLYMSKDYVTFNNFENNTQDAQFMNAPIYETYYKATMLINPTWTKYYAEYKIFGTTKWNHNYWGTQNVVFPHPIYGERGLYHYMMTMFGKWKPNRVAFDWNPSAIPFQPY